MADPDLVSYAQHIGAAFKLGSGLLGKSAIALGLLLFAIIVAVFRLHSDIAIFSTLVFAAIVFFIWFFPVIRFAEASRCCAFGRCGVEWFPEISSGCEGIHSSAIRQNTFPFPGSTAALPPGKNSDPLPEDTDK